MAGYQNQINNAWLAIQVYPTSRLEIFANTAFNSGRANITDFDYSAGDLTGVLFGLDYPLHSAAMSGFSDLKIRRIGQVVGANYRVANNWVVNGVLVYDDYNDYQPWLEDTSGEYLNVYAGLSWIF